MIFLFKIIDNRKILCKKKEGKDYIFKSLKIMVIKNIIKESKSDF